MDKTMNRRKAREAGLTHYFTGIPCKYGHIAKREATGGVCIECKKTIYRPKRLQNHKDYGHRTAKKKRMEERQGNNRPKYLARCAVRNAIVSGLLTKRPCQRCGAAKLVHAHHDDYSKPLEVMWLCPTHHKQRHRELTDNGWKASDE